MTLAAFETSVHAGAPVELYRFALGVQRWLYTSADVPVVYLGETYAPAAIRRGALAAADSAERAELTLECDLALAPAQLFIAGTPAGVLELTLYRLHRGDDDVVAQWRGRVAAGEYAGLTVRLGCRAQLADAAAVRAPVPVQRLCPYALYDERCRVVDSAWRAEGSASAVSGAQVQAAVFATQADGWWVGGRLVGDGHERLIVAHAGTAVVLVTPIPGLVAGMAIAVYPGCDHTLATCWARFGNGLNHGGHAWLPLKNPFSGDAPA